MSFGHIVTRSLWLAPLIVNSLATGAARTAPPTPPQRTDRYGDPLPSGALARLGTVRFRYNKLIGNVVYSHDGKYLAAAGYGGAIRIYDAATGKRLRQFDAQAHQYPSITFAPDGKTLACLGTKIIHIWDVEVGKERRRFKVEASDEDANNYTIPLVFSADGSLLASVATDLSVRVWETKTGKELAVLHGDPNPICCLAFSTDGKTLFSASDWGALAGSVRVWSVAQSKELRRFFLYVPKTGTHPAPLCFSPDRKTLALASWEHVFRNQANRVIVHNAQSVALLDLKSGRVRRKLGPLLGRLKTASFSPDGTIVAAMNDDRSAKDGATKDEISRIKGWNTATGGRVFNLPAYNTSPPFWGGEGTLLAFAPDGNKLAAASGSSLHVWDWRQEREEPNPEAHENEVSHIAFSPDGRTVASASADHTIALWDAATSRHLLRLHGHEGAITALAFSPDGTRLATASRGLEQTVRIWGTLAGTELRRFEVPYLPPDQGKRMGVATWLTFASHGKILAASGTDGKIRLSDADRGKELLNTHIEGLPKPAEPNQRKRSVMPCEVAAFTADGRLLALLSAQTIHVADTLTGQQLFRYPRDPYSGRIALSPDGKTLACLGDDLRLMETASGKDVCRIKLGSKPSTATFSRDGRTLAIGDASPSGTIRLFDVPSGKETLTLRGQDCLVRSIAFSPDGTKLASGQSDSTALIWDVSAARRKLRPKNLTPPDLERLWMELRDADAAKAHAALWMLAAAPDQTVPFLKAHLHPVPRVTAARLHRLIDDLDSAEFTRREEASHNLAKLGIEAVPALRQVLASKPSLEMRRRAEMLLEDLACQTAMTPDALRQLRAIQVLEQIGSAEARQILASLAQGAPAAPATRDAAAALARLDRRAARR